MTSSTTGPDRTAAVHDRRRAATRGGLADIVGAGVLSAAGSGLDPLRGLAAPAVGALAAAPVALGGAGLGLSALPVAGFDPATVLGGRGLSRLSRSDQLAMAACLAALDAAGAGAVGSGQTGIVLGTSVGSTGTVLAFLRDTFEQARPYLVDPAQFPSVMLNSAAGRTAIRCGLTGVNATVAGGPVAGFHAVRYAGRVLRAGQARRMLAGAVEEVVPELGLAWRRGGLATGVPLAEGAAVFVLDGPDTVAGDDPLLLGRVLAAETGFVDSARGAPAVAARLAECVRAAVSRAGITPDQVSLLAPGALGRRGWAAVEERALREVFGARPGRLRLADRVGESLAAGVGLQLAGVLANWSGQTSELAVLTNLGLDGSVGCLVVTRAGEFTGERK